MRGVPVDLRRLTLHFGLAKVNGIQLAIRMNKTGEGWFGNFRVLVSSHCTVRRIVTCYVSKWLKYFGVAGYTKINGQLASTLKEIFNWFTTRKF